jgi:hypothetical protein
MAGTLYDLRPGDHICITGCGNIVIEGVGPAGGPERPMDRGAVQHKVREEKKVEIRR